MITGLPALVRVVYHSGLYITVDTYSELSDRDPCIAVYRTMCVVGRRDTRIAHVSDMYCAGGAVANLRYIILSRTVLRTYTTQIQSRLE